MPAKSLISKNTHFCDYFRLWITCIVLTKIKKRSSCLKRLFIIWEEEIPSSITIANFILPLNAGCIIVINASPTVWSDVLCEDRPSYVQQRGYRV